MQEGGNMHINYSQAIQENEEDRARAWNNG
jgi:hypothetical protein